MKKTKVLTVITNGTCITFGIHKIHLHNIRNSQNTKRREILNYDVREITLTRVHIDGLTVCPIIESCFNI